MQLQAVLADAAHNPMTVVVFGLFYSATAHVQKLSGEHRAP